MHFCLGTTGCVVDASQTITELATRSATNGIMTDTVTTVLTIPVISLASSPLLAPTTSSQHAQGTSVFVGGTTPTRQGVGSESVIVTPVGGASTVPPTGETAATAEGGALTTALPMVSGGNSINTSLTGPGVGSGPSSAGNAIEQYPGANVDHPWHYDHPSSKPRHGIRCPTKRRSATNRNTDNRYANNNANIKNILSSGRPLGTAAILGNVIRCHHRNGFHNKRNIGCVFIGKGLTHYVVNPNTIASMGFRLALDRPTNLPLFEAPPPPTPICGSPNIGGGPPTGEATSTLDNAPFTSHGRHPGFPPASLPYSSDKAACGFSCGHRNSCLYWRKAYVENYSVLLKMVEELETKLHAIQRRIEAVETKTSYEPPWPGHVFSPATPVAMDSILLPPRPSNPTPASHA
ncbi:hypothetical protein CHU98_g2316 [Xylaria longipes]|nr:hypothetical protein CHU98_g2316 [Xylaria longipes]